MVASFTLVGCTNNETKQEEIVIPEVTEKGTVVVLTTGGTIAGKGESDKETGYEPGQISGQDLIDSVEGLGDVANIEVVEVCDKNSDDITYEDWFNLVSIINEMASNDDIDGFVVTHGTDTMEETAYFLNLTIKTDKPVVITGAMRPVTSLSADGPINLYQSVCLAKSKEAIGKGVLCVFANNIYSARTLIKASTYSLTALSSGTTGCLGVMRNDTPYFYEESTKKHTTNSEFTIDGLDSLPSVNIVYFSVDSDPEILKTIASKSQGLVIAGAGAGEFSEEYIEIINGLSIPVVISSRVDDGIITQDAVLCSNSVAANNLSPQKAAILLKLAIASNIADFDNLVRIYSEY